jgi:hypothetical protein
MMRIGARAGLFAVSVVLICTSPARAGFVQSVTGAADVVSAPVSSMPGDFESDRYRIWEETSGQLSADLALDHAGQAGSFDGLSNFSATSTVLAAGTSYSSTMVHLDAATSIPDQQPIASITFTDKIIGLALFRTSLAASDVYGNPTTVYPTGLPDLFLQGRGIDLAHDDRFEISADGKTLSLQLTSGLVAIDQIRVFTGSGGGTQVPEPASWAVWCGLGMVVAAVRQARKGIRTAGFDKSGRLFGSGA